MSNRSPNLRLGQLLGQLEGKVASSRQVPIGPEFQVNPKASCLTTDDAGATRRGRPL